MDDDDFSGFERHTKRRGPFGVVTAVVVVILILVMVFAAAELLGTSIRVFGD